MTTAEKIEKLEQVGLDWFEIAKILDISYSLVRDISEDNLKEPIL